MAGAAALLVVGVLQREWGVAARALAVALLILIPAMTYFRDRSNVSNAASATVVQRLIGHGSTNLGPDAAGHRLLIFRTFAEGGEGHVGNAIFGAVGALSLGSCSFQRSSFDQGQAAHAVSECAQRNCTMHA